MNTMENVISYHDDVIMSTYEELVVKLGAPTHPEISDDYKVQKEWMFELPNGTKFTIYDWKNYEMDVTDGSIIEWHIGYDGTPETFAMIDAYLSEHDVKMEKSSFYKERY